MLINKEKPFYSVSQVAELLGISADRLRTYDEEKLIAPVRIGKGIKRLYSELDVEWLKDVRSVIAKNKMNIYSLRLILCILNKLSDEIFDELSQNSSDDIWIILKRMKKNPNFVKLTSLN